MKIRCNLLPKVLRSNPKAVKFLSLIAIYIVGISAKLCST